MPNKPYRDHSGDSMADVSLLRPVAAQAPSNAIATLTFTPKFGKPVRQTTGSSDQGLIVPVVFSNKVSLASAQHLS